MLGVLRSLILDNLLAKLGCLGLATVLWFWVMMAGTVEERIEGIPVHVDNLPANVQLVPGTNPTVSLQLSGSSLRRLDPDEVRIQVEIEEVEFPRTTHEIMRSEVDIPEGWELDSIEPRIVTFELRSLEEEVFSLEPNLVDLSNEYEMETHVIPSQARIRGPAEYLSGLEMIRLERVSLADVSPPGDDFNVAALIPSGIELIEPETNEFQLRVNVFERVDRHEISEVPIEVTGVPEGWRAVVDPPTLTVVIQGPREQVVEVEPEDIRILVPSPDPEDGRSIELARIELPEGIELAAGFSRHQPVQIRLEEDDGS